MTGVSPAEALASELEGKASGYMPAFVLFAAAELGLFDVLDVPRSVNELAERVGATPDGVRRLCRVLASMGLLSLRMDQVEATAEAIDVLSARGARSIASTLRHHQRLVVPLFTELANAVRSGEPQHAAWRFASRPVAESSYAELVRHPEELQTFLAAMDASSTGVGTALAAELRDLDVRRIVDLGCGGGQVAREILLALPDAVVESFDLEPVAAIARSRSAELGGRHLVSAGDIRQGVDSTGADAVLLSAILADFSEPDRARILETARRSLRPGGHLVISETLIDEDRLGPPGALMLSLIMLLAMRGDQLSADQLRIELDRAGFAEVRVRRGAPRDLVVARLPSAAGSEP